MWNCSHQFFKNIPVIFDYIATWNHGVFLCLLCNSFCYVWEIHSFLIQKTVQCVVITGLRTANRLRLHIFSTIFTDTFASSPDDWAGQCNVLVMIRCDPLFVPIATTVRPVTLRGSLLHGGSGVAPRGRSNPSCRLHGVHIQPSSLQNRTPVSCNM